MTRSKELPLGFSSLRMEALNHRPINPEGDYVLYWMIAARRCSWNFALQRAVEAARQLGVGLIIFEPLRCDYPYASDRLHHFMLEGMAVNARSLKNKPVFYYPWVETQPDEGKGLLASLAENASLVVTDNFPTFFLSTMVKAAAEKIPVRLESIDGNGLLPMAAAERDYPTAFAFRRLLHQALPAFIDELPHADPLADCKLPKIDPATKVLERWPTANLPALLAPGGLTHLPIDHGVCPAPVSGGSKAATTRLQTFLCEDLEHYAAERNVPDLDRTSRLSPWLHFGHISAHQIFSALATREKWTSNRLPLKPTGKRSGWWGMSESTEAFLDELVTWRELSYGFCHQRPDYADYAGLPEWARVTLEEHARDQRSPVYSLEELATASTHDPLWNAAQQQLLAEGRIHGYLRMLWGKRSSSGAPTHQRPCGP